MLFTSSLWSSCVLLLILVVLIICFSNVFYIFELCSPSQFNGLELAYLIILVILICVFLVDLVI